ncbi:hypothetical protein BIW11_07787 [Tropilaelaps mercedesae]|uniref:Uncharacterized protein n=1 Tax=Tropilaelaps mercedesae TaxID=418985 RepID=A0A1V9XSF0_9ACAR|nr:hypothetical protein BIW11_07787 [Tropilaelaps mercedesae]
MDMCNLADAVPGNNGPKFSDMEQEEKLHVCRSLKTALDCSSLYSCDRLTRLVNGGQRFFNVFCTKIFTKNGLSLDTCVRSAHKEAVDKCANHLEKMKALANHVSPNEEAIRQACCEHRTYADCYRREVSARCSMEPSTIPLHPDRRVDIYCSKDYNKDSTTLCREERQLNFDSVPASISASSALRSFSVSTAPALVLCSTLMILWGTA